MQFLVIFKIAPGVTPQEMRPVLEPETAETWQLFKKGVVRQMWYLPREPHQTVGRGGNIILMECADEEEARAIVDALPLVVGKLVTADFYVLEPGDAYEMLFADAYKAES